MTRQFHSLLAAGLLAASASAATSAQRGPAPVATNLPHDVIALACAPTMVFEAPPMPLRITGGQDSVVRRIYQPGDLVTINAGTDNGIDVGQEYYVRRVLTGFSQQVGRETPGLIRTAGWLRVYAVDKRMSLATITHACDSVETGDYLEPFALPQPPAASTEKHEAQRGNYGRVLLGADRRASFGQGDLFVVDRGSDHGVMPGMQFVVYRDKRQAGNFLFELGEAVAVDVKAETSTLRVTQSRDGFTTGDYVAMRK